MANNNNTAGAIPSGTEKVINAVIKGLQNAIPATTLLVIAGVSSKASQIITTLKGDLPVFTNVDSSKAAYRKALAARTSALPDIRKYLAQLKTALEAQLGKGNPVLAQFGYSVGKKKTLTAAEKTAAAAKRAATLAKRGVVGKRKRAQVVAPPQPVIVSPSGAVTPADAPVNPAQANALPTPAVNASALSTGSNTPPAPSGANGPASSGNGTA